MIFRKGGIKTALEHTDWQVESRRTELALVIAIWPEIMKRRIGATGKDMAHNAINLRITATTALVIRPTSIADARQDQPVPDQPQLLFILL